MLIVIVRRSEEAMKIDKLIRRFILKGKNISEISKKEIKEIERWLNHYPRRLFLGKTSEEI